MTELDSLYPPIAAMISEVCSPIAGWYDGLMPKSTRSSEGFDATDAAIGNQLFRLVVEAGGRVALPDAVRERLGVAEGDHLVLKLREDDSPIAILAPLTRRTLALERLSAAGRVVPPKLDLLDLGPPPDRPHEMAISEALAEQREERLK